jgi:mono/diheme cytochrome c family protein
MVRLSAPLAALALALSACTGLVESSGGGDTTLTPEEVAARTAFTDKAKPVFDTNCASCHSGSDPTVAFLKGGSAMEVRATLLGYDPQVVNLEAPASSRVLTKGAHSGPSLTGQQSSDILTWINAERDAAGATGTAEQSLETEHFTPLLCTPPAQPGDAACPFNTVDISGLVEGWGGAQIKFVAQALGSDLYVTDLALVGGPDGVYLEHPLFVSWPADPEAEGIPDSLDRFFNVKLNVMPGDDPASIGGGTAAFISFTPTNQLSILFKVVDKYRPDGDGGMGGTVGDTGCKALTEFKANAQPQLQSNCASCHANAGNTSARGAMDLVGLSATDDETLKGVCDQARTRINFQDTEKSGFYIAPNPNDTTNHQFKFGTQGAYDTFKAAVDVWIQAEKTAQ